MTAGVPPRVPPRTRSRADSDAAASRRLTAAGRGAACAGIVCGDGDTDVGGRVGGGAEVAHTDRGMVVVVMMIVVVVVNRAR